MPRRVFFFLKFSGVRKYNERTPLSKCLTLVSDVLHYVTLKLQIYRRSRRCTGYYFLLPLAAAYIYCKILP